LWPEVRKGYENDDIIENAYMYIKLLFCYFNFILLQILPLNKKFKVTIHLFVIEYEMSE